MSSAPVRPLRPSQKTGAFKVIQNETPAIRTARIHEETQLPPRTPRDPRKAAYVPALLARLNNTPAKSFTKVPSAATVEISSTNILPETSAELISADTVLPLSTTTSAKSSNRAPPAATVDSNSNSAPSEVFTDPLSATTVESSAIEDPTARDPNARKRVSWSSDEMPLKFYKDRPPHNVGLASIRKSSTDLVDTPQRVPVNKDSINLIGETSTSIGNETSKHSNRQILRCPPGGSTAILSVEPYGLPASEANHLSVDEKSSIRAPNVAEQRSDYNNTTRFSQGPRILASRKEGLKTTNDSRTSLRVYEDDKESVDLWLQVAMEDPTLSSPRNDRVLGELPINTDIPKRSNSISTKTNTEDNVTIYRTRQLIERSIPRILEGTFDEDGYRKLKSLVWQDSTWATGDEGKTIFDELILSIQSVLQGSAAYAEMGFDRLHPLRTQVVLLLQALNVMNEKDLDRWSIQLVRAMIMARDDYPNNTRMGMFLNYGSTLTRE